jgi:phosphoribosylanthranilate isomerase
VQPTQRPRVKICCIGSVEEAKLAIDYGASALGLVSEMPSGSGTLFEGAIAEIAASVPPMVASFLLSSKTDTASIIAQQRRLGANTIQLCHRLQSGTHQELRQALPGISLVQVIHVVGEESIEEAIAIAPHVHGLLLDSGNSSTRKELGGTGHLHDWTISRRIRELVDIPVFLSGGLSPDNVGEAVRQVHPFGVDVCSGVRTHKKLDQRKLSQFFRELTSSFEKDFLPQ